MLNDGATGTRCLVKDGIVGSALNRGSGVPNQGRSSRICGAPVNLKTLLLSCGLVLATSLAAADEKSTRPPAGFEREVAGIRDAAAGHRMILLGEKHATAEIPQLVAALVEELSAQEPLVLALEMPRSEQAAMQQYLASDGGADARAALRAGAWWQVIGTQHDGRRNEDVIDMIERLRVLKSSGRELRLLPFDTAPGTTRSHHERDRAMADYLREQFVAAPAARFVVLAGNVHAMVRKPGYAPPEMQQPMGAYLIDLDPYSINISAREGQFWGCMGGQCAPRDERPARFESGPARDGDAYHYQLVLPRFSVARLPG